MTEKLDERVLQRLQNALGRVKSAEAQLSYARRDLRRMMQDELTSSRVTQADIARAFGISRQQIKRLLERD
jgi:DNA-binding transcriptional regulator LsrR (DeoR family)